MNWSVFWGGDIFLQRRRKLKYWREDKWNSDFDPDSYRDGISDLSMYSPPAPSLLRNEGVRSRPNTDCTLLEAAPSLRQQRGGLRGWVHLIFKNLHREHREDTEGHRVLISNWILAPRPWERGWGEAGPQDECQGGETAAWRYFEWEIFEMVELEEILWD